MKSQAIPNKAGVDARKFEHRKTRLSTWIRVLLSRFTWDILFLILSCASPGTVLPPIWYSSLLAGLYLVQRFAHECWVCLHLTCGEVTEVSFPIPQEGHTMVRVSLVFLHVQGLQESLLDFFVEILYFPDLVFCRLVLWKWCMTEQEVLVLESGPFPICTRSICVFLVQ